MNGLCVRTHPTLGASKSKAAGLISNLSHCHSLLDVIQRAELYQSRRPLLILKNAKMQDLTPNFLSKDGI